jgi:hypothetical protein
MSLSIYLAKQLNYLCIYSLKNLDKKPLNTIVLRKNSTIKENKINKK